MRLTDEQFATIKNYCKIDQEMIVALNIIYI